MSYVELHCHSAYSFLDGASHPVELAAVAAEQGHAALALTDHDGLHGAMEHARACRGLGIRPITGAEITLEDGAHITLLVESAAGYRNLCRLITTAHEGTREGAQRTAGQPSLALREVERCAGGLVCLTGCARDGALPRMVERGDHAGAGALGRRLRDAFGDGRLRVELQRPFARTDRRRNRHLAQLAERLEVPCVATGNVHVHARERTRLQDAFVAARLGATLDESEPARRGNSSHALAAPAAMHERFREHSEAVHEAGRLAERLEFDLNDDLGYTYPGAEDPTANSRLAELCKARIGERYEGRASRPEAEARLDQELAIIAGLRLSGFFLLHRDMLELAREVAAEVRGADGARALLPPGRGRGSSVSSIVCFLTGLSGIDPVENALTLGRFLHEDLTTLPDIDIDFPRDIREVLIPRVHERYGHDRSALVASFATYRVKSAIRDFGKALGLPPGEVERLAGRADPWAGNEISGDVAEAAGKRAHNPRWAALVHLVRESAGLPRHMGQHPGGMVISTRPLIDICPVQPAAMEGRQMVQWDKDSCQDAGFLKIDLLGLGMLSAIERCVSEVERVRGERIDLTRIDYADRKVYSEIQLAETMGVFQIESRAQMQMLKRTLPESLDDLTVQVALVRPGPIQGGAVHPYIQRKKALREDPAFEVPYPHPSLEPVLRDTLGAIVFQDQVIEVAQAFAGFSAGEAEGLRRAMSRARSEAAMRSYEEKFIAGGIASGASEETARSIYAQIVGFSGFGFPKSHSAAFGLLAYQSTWLRVYYGPEFLCSLLNEQPMGFYPPDTLVHEAQRRGLEVLPPSVGASGVLCRVEASDFGLRTSGVRLGLGYVLGMRQEDAVLVAAGAPYSSAADLVSRSGASADGLAKLAWAGACDELCAGGRREALWMLGASVPADGDQLALPVEPGDAPELRELTPWERMVADYGSTNVTLDEHPLELMRPMLAQDIRSSTDLEHMRHGERVRVAGLVVARQRPATAKGVTFMLLEDELGTINLIVPPPVHDACRLAVRTEPLVVGEGRLEHREGTINVLVDRVVRLERPDIPLGEVRHIEPTRTWSSDDGETPPGSSSGDAGPTRRRLDELRGAMPAAHSFGRRGR